jgi:two-component system cell cycle sensor histidine kinase/response regulator CckA
VRQDKDHRSSATGANCPFSVPLETIPFPAFLFSVSESAADPASIIEANGEACRLYGYTPDEIRCLPASALCPDCSNLLQSELGRETAIFEADHWTKSGEEFPVEVNSRLVFRSGRCLVLSIHRDISHSKRLKLAAVRSEKKYRDLFENANDAIFLVDSDLNYIDVNKKAVDLFGYSREEFLQMNITDVIPPQQRPRSDREFARLSKEGSYEKFVGKLRTKNGRWLDIEVSSSAIIENGRFIGSRDIVRDITDRMQAYARLEERVKERTAELARANKELQLEIEERRRIERSLRESEENYRQLVQAAHSIILRWDAEGRILFMNDYGLKLFGYAKEEIFDRPALGTIIPFMDTAGRDLQPMVADLLRDPDSSAYNENENVCKDGRRLWISWSNRAVLDPDGAVREILSVGTDFTARRASEQELQRTQKLESLGIFAGGIAHDFNNLLTSILGNIELARLFSERYGKAWKRLNLAEKAALQAKGLTRQLSTFAKGGSPVFKVVPMTVLIKDCVDFSLRGARVKAELDIAEDLWHAEVDEGQVCQVIQNLVRNAEQAMPGGGTIMVTAGNLHLDRKSGLPLHAGKYLEIAIRDQGEGIPEKLLGRIFDPYFTTKKTGSGLGLAVCYSIIRHHGGHIAARSEPGAGATFYVYLPATNKKPRARQLEKAVAPGPGRLLAMDDQNDVKEILSELLVRLGYDVEFASRGEEVLAMYKAARDLGRPYDALILDLTIPGGMGGEETIRRLLELDPAVKAIVSSGYVNDPVMADHSRYGFRGAVPKPYRSDELAQVLAAVVGEKHTSRPSLK